MSQRITRVNELLRREIGQHACQLAAAMRRCQQHVVAQHLCLLTPFVAMAAHIADQPHQRARASGRFRALFFGLRNRIDLRQSLEKMNATVHYLLALNMRLRQMPRFLQMPACRGPAATVLPSGANRR